MTVIKNRQKSIVFYCFLSY